MNATHHRPGIRTANRQGTTGGGPCLGPQTDGQPGWGKAGSPSLEVCTGIATGAAGAGPQGRESDGDRAATGCGARRGQG